MIDLNEVYIFIKVVEAGSFVRASELTGIPTSTISRRVSELEKRLGAILIQRTTRKLNLTQKGILYYEYVSQGLKKFNDADLVIQENQLKPYGTLRIASSYSFGTEILKDIIFQFLEKYKDVSIDLRLDNNYIDLITNNIDIAFRMGPLEDSNSFRAKKIYSFSNILCATENYLKNAPPLKHPNDLVNHSCLIASSFNKKIYWNFENGLERVEVLVSGKLKTNSLLLSLEAALNDMGVIYFPSFFVYKLLNEGKLIKLLSDWESSKRDVYGIYPNLKHTSINISTFLDFTKNRINKL